MSDLPVSVKKSLHVDTKQPNIIKKIFSTSDSSNDDDPDRSDVLLALNGERIHFDFVTSERIEQPVVFINGDNETQTSVTQMDNSSGFKDGKHWRASYRVDKISDRDVSEVVFRISSFIDPAGNNNSLTDFSIDDNGSRKIAIDVTDPEIVLGSIAFSTSDSSNDDDPDRNDVLLALDERGSILIF